MSIRAPSIGSDGETPAHGTVTDRLKRGWCHLTPCDDEDQQKPPNLNE